MNRRAAALWLAATLFIVYGGTIPFDLTFDSAAAIAKLARVPLDPLISPDTGRRISITDTIQNLLLFVPFGVFGFIALGGLIRSVWARAAAVTGLGAALSAGVEVLQLFEPDRTTSFADLLNNTLGAAGGAATAHAARRLWVEIAPRLRRRGLVDVPAFYPLLIATLVVVIAAWQPFDFVLDISALAGRLRVLRGDPWQFTIVSDEGVEFLRYAIFTLCGSLWLRQLGVQRYAALSGAGATAIAIALEASQWVIGSRMPGLADAGVHAAGALAGAGLSWRWPWHRSPAFWCVVLGAATAAAAAVQMLSPFEVAAVRRPMSWRPFDAYYRQTTIATVSHCVELALLYVPSGFAIAASLRRPRTAMLTAVAGTIVVAGLLEYMQGWIVGRYGDVTDVAVAVLGAASGVWAGGTGWRQFSSAGRFSATPAS
jgi:VanZ family protein